MLRKAPARGYTVEVNRSRLGTCFLEALAASFK